MMRLARLTLLCVLVLSPSLIASAQDQQGAQPDRWRGLVLDQSTPEDAICILGQPASDKVDRIRVFQIDKWLSKKQSQKIFRKLTFKAPEGIDKATLAFLDNKLVMIELDVKKGISPNGLANIYGVEFRPMVDALTEAMYPQDFERNQGKVYPKSYPTYYHLVAVSKESFISAGIGNAPSFMGALAKSAGVGDAEGSYPGRVEVIQIISRKLENRDGADVLK